MQTVANETVVVFGEDVSEVETVHELEELGRHHSGVQSYRKNTNSAVVDAVVRYNHVVRPQTSQLVTVGDLLRIGGNWFQGNQGLG